MFKSPLELVLLVTTVVAITLVTVRLSDKDSNTSSLSSPVINVLPSPIATRGGDDRYTMAPRPQRVWDNGPEIPVRGGFGLDSLATRGAPEAYQQMGVILGEDGKPLPLYGRRTAPRSDRFNYYTRTDSYNPVALPVLFKKRDCQDGVGCDEVMSGDEVRIGATGNSAKVTLYGFDGPRYQG
jgi:hypothetical protein